jgi:hypothetical protein
MFLELAVSLSILLKYLVPHIINMDLSILPPKRCALIYTTVKELPVKGLIEKLLDPDGKIL